MREEKIVDEIISLSIVGVIICFLVFVFVIWGGHPRGLWWQVKDLREEQDAFFLNHRHKYQDGSVIFPSLSDEYKNRARHRSKEE